MKTSKSKKCLKLEGWTDTGMKFSDYEIWRNGQQRLLYDPKSKEIIQVYWADERHLTSNKPTGDFSVGEREHQ